MKIVNVLIYALIATTLAGCIGVVDSKDPNSTINATIAEKTIAFDGLANAIPISDSKVELYWYPAQGNPSDITYYIHVNNSQNPFHVNAESLDLLPSGMYRYTIKSLKINTPYSFRVSVQNANTGAKSDNDKELSASTFANRTADFGGISRVRLAEGEAGKNTVIVEWAKAVTVGTTSSRPTDPLQYEIRYISSQQGKAEDLFDIENPAVTIVREPISVNSSSMPSSATSRIITGLVSGNKYYFLVRCIHANYLLQSEEPEYKREENRSYLSIETRSSDNLFDFDSSYFSVQSSPGELGLTALDLSWRGATGNYNHYRVYHLKAAEPDADLIDVEAIADKLDVDAINLLNQDSNSYLAAEAGKESLRVRNLESFAYYHIKIAACKTVTCGDDQRLVSDLVLARVVPRKAPFNGIISIDNPASTDALTEVILNFNPPVMTYGFANKVKVYCFANDADNNPVEVTSDVPTISIISNCDGMQLASPLPTSINGISSLNEISIKTVHFPANSSVSDLQYCFSVVPVIESPYLPADMERGIVKCKIPEIEVPTNREFKGKNDVCTQEGIGSLGVSWELPSNGIYTDFQVFWKKKNGIPFRFADAVSGTHPSYFSTDVGGEETKYIINGAMPGEEYEVGVLSYIEIDGNRKYSQFNSSTSPCKSQMPKAKFMEWVDVFAVGAKVDGRVPPSVLGELTYIPETLDDDMLPIEIPIDGSNNPIAEFTERFGDRTSATLLSGVYGSLEAGSGVVKHQYSKSGIIRIVWRDLSVKDSPVAFTPIINSFENPSNAVVQKKNRKYGYKVFRSSDGRKTWNDLTSGAFPYQTSGNSGLIRAEEYTEYNRINTSENKFNVGSFTDYSVQNYISSGDTDKARIYYYKIVPYFNGQPIAIENIEQSIIKVVLPPPNMALVNRLTYNRSMCLEIGKDPILDKNFYYGCYYNGLGSKGLSIPWTTSQSMLDLGGDLLVDRFELGCNFTRGDVNNQTSNFTSDTFDFKGLADSGAKFKGCVQADSLYQNLSDAWQDGPNTPAEGSAYASYRQVLRGDCIGSDTMRFSTNSTSVCADSNYAEYTCVNFPGARGQPECTNIDNVSANYLNPYYKEGMGGNDSYEQILAQSEYAAVYYTRHNKASYSCRHANAPSTYRAADGESGNSKRIKLSNSLWVGGCYVNLPSVDQSANASFGSGRWKPRWLPTSRISGLNVVDGATTVSTKNLISKTIGQIIGDTQLYDDTKNSLPGSIASNRFNLNTSLGRVFSSNNAKLPPLNGFTPKDANELCGTYKVEVGYTDSSNNYKVIESSKEKRIIRRKEFIASSAWPKHFEEPKVISLEKGTLLTDSVNGGVSNNSACNAIEKDLPFKGSLKTGDELFSVIAGNNTNPRLLTGSSYFDTSATNSDTQKCQSRFGIQDIIGNNGELSSEVLKCKYGGDILYIGQGAVDSSVVAPTSGLYDLVKLFPWVLSDPDTGRCSMVEEGSLRLYQSTIGAYIAPTKLHGSLNASVIKSVKNFDPFSVDDIRSGDGYFLDFGQGNFASPISYNDTLALNFDSIVKSRSSQGPTVDPRRSKYFNPVIGIPLECSSYNEMTGCSSSQDNTLISTESLVALSGIEVDQLEVANFPVGNSQILSDGMSELKGGFRYDTPSMIETNVRFIDSVDPANGAISYVEGGLSSITEPRKIFEYGWLVERNSELTVSNGGGSDNNINGRYSARITDSDSRYVLGNSGIRCVIKVGEYD